MGLTPQAAPAILSACEAGDGAEWTEQRMTRRVLH